VLLLSRKHLIERGASSLRHERLVANVLTGDMQRHHRHRAAARGAATRDAARGRDCRRAAYGVSATSINQQCRDQHQNNII